MAEVVPEDVVGPAALVAGGADVDEPLDEEAAGNVPDPLLAGAAAGQQRLALLAKAHRVAEAIDLAAALAGRFALGYRVHLAARGVSVTGGAGVVGTGERVAGARQQGMSCPCRPLRG